MTLAPGTRLGTFEIVGPLGAGGMGEVHRARDTRLGRDVAIKSLPLEFARDPERLARFEREAKLLASLSHSNIAGIHGLEEVDGARYLVLEFVEGETLASRLERGPLPLDEAVAVARQIAAGVEAAHESGVVHRDLKPGNVMLTPSGAVKVLDFGLAKSGFADRAGSDASLSASPTMTHAATQAGVILGTAAYMSPEQARGRAVDKRTDIWSFGCVLYECLTGRQAFKGETVSDLIAQILQTEPEWGLLPAPIPTRVRALLERCLRKDARERLRDIGEARIALTAAPEAELRPAATSRSRAVPWWIAGATVLVFSAIAVGVTLRFGPASQRHPVRKFDLIANDMVVDWPNAPRLSPDGSRIAYVSANRVWVRDLDQLAPRAVAEISAPGPFNWSPDSRMLVYADKKKLWTVSVAGGQPTNICEIPGTGSIVGATWNASGMIAFSVWRNHMYQVPARGGRPTALIEIDPSTQIDFHSPAWLANGQLLYVTHWKVERDSSGQLRPSLMIFDGKRQLGIHGVFGGNYDEAPVLTPAGRLLYLKSGATPGVWAIPFDLKARRAAGTPVLVAPDAVTLSVAADGSLLYVEGATLNVPHELVWVDRTGKVMASVGAAHIGLTHPRLSPDGRRIAFSASDGGNEDVWVLDLRTGNEIRLTFGAMSEGAPEWLASSTRLAYIEHDDMQARVLSINADGSGAQRVFAPTADFQGPTGNVRMAPDGRSAIRILDQRGHGSLQIGPVLADGSLGPLKPLLSQVPEPNVSGVGISPDGRLIAFQTNDPGQIDVFLARFPGGEGRWQVGIEGGSRPRWARDTGELFFVAGSGPSSRTLVSARVDPSQDQPLGALTRLFATRIGLDLADFDVAADGQRVLATRPLGGVDGTARHLVLVQNWESELAGRSKH